MRSLLNIGVRSGFDTVEIDSPANRNALSVELLQALLAQVELSAAGESRGMLLQHTGPAFCSGVDLKQRRELGPTDSSHSRMLAELLRRLWHYPKPLVVEVDGAVRGGGLGLLACADLVVASSRSSFAYSESRVGVAPALVMAVTLPLGSARGLLPRLLDGGVFDTESALAIGLVQQVGGPEDTDAALAELVRGAPQAQATIKRLTRNRAEADMDGLLEQMAAVSADLFAGDEATEGVAAFADRRPPRWVVSA